MERKENRDDTNGNFELIDRFRQTLEKADFERLPKTIQRIFYTAAINCHKRCSCKKCNYSCDHPVCENILKYYDKLLIDTGIHGRKELSTTPAQKIPDTLKATLKSECIRSLIQKNNLIPQSVYFYDDSETIVTETKKLDINSILVKDIHLQFNHLLDLIKKKLNTDEPSEPSLVLIDFDKTFSTHRFRKRYLRYDIDTIITRFFGGKHRLKLLFQGLKKLEVLGVKIGFITFHSKNVLLEVLDRLGWVQSHDTGDSNIV
jgi:hypothetical protein